MSKRVGMFIIAACVAAALVVLVWKPWESKSPSPTVSTKPTSPVAVYPERGYTVGVSRSKEDKSLKCGDIELTDLASIVLADSGGTVSHNGTLITTAYTKDTVTVTFKGDVPYVSGIVTSAEGGQVSFNIPDEVQGKNSPGIVLNASTDFKEVSPIKTVTLCGGGM